MMSLVNQDYYQLLNISKHSTSVELDKAYLSTKQFYTEDSVAHYSLYSSAGKKDMLKTIDLAYEILSDPETRHKYDEELSKVKAEIHKTIEVDIKSIVGERGKSADTVTLRPKPIEVTKTAMLKQPLAIDVESKNAFLEQYRILFTNLESISLTNSYKVFALTSAVEGEGKSLNAVNLSYVMAKEFNKKVLLIECDLRKPSFSTYFEWPESIAGIKDFIERKAGITDIIAQVDNSGLYVVHAGRDAKTAQRSNYENVKPLLDRVRYDFDYIMLDAPPILPLADISILSRLVDGLVLVVRAAKTPKDTVLKAVRAIPEANIIGLILNGAETGLSKYSY